jgi:hypothetical protein
LQLFLKKQFLGYEDLTKKKQDHAITLPKGIYIQNIMSKMRLLRSATKMSPTIKTDALSDIGFDSPPDIHREPNNIIQKHAQKNKMSPQQNFIAPDKFLSQQAEDDTDDQYSPPKEINIGVQNSNLLLTSDMNMQILLKDHHGEECFFI